jgi:hypothetical protein
VDFRTHYAWKAEEGDATECRPKVPAVWSTGQFALFRRYQSLESCVAANLELHVSNVSHDNGHLCPLCSLVEQRHLTQVVGGLGGSLACTLAVGSVLEAWVSLRPLGVLLCLLVHGAVEVLLLA